MLDIINMEFYRLRKSGAFYVVVLILIFLGVVSPIITTGSNEQVDSLVEQGFSIIESDYSTTIFKETKLETLLNLFLGGNILIVIAIIFTSIFAGAYSKTSFEKNIIGAIGKRFRLPVATFIMIVMSILIFLLVAISSTFIGEYFINRSEFTSKPLGSIQQFIGYVTTYFVILVSISSFVMVLMQLFRNQLLVLVLGLIHGSGIVFGIFNILVESITQKTIAIESSFPFGMALNLSISQNSFIQEIATASIGIAITLVVTIYLKQKQDIRS